MVKSHPFGMPETYNMYHCDGANTVSFVKYRPIYQYASGLLGDLAYHVGAHLLLNERMLENH